MLILRLKGPLEIVNSVDPTLRGLGDGKHNMNTKRYLIHGFAMFITWTTLTASFPAFSVADVSANTVLESLRNRIEGLQHTGKITIRDSIIHTRISLPRFYEARGFQPAWMNETDFRPEVNEALAMIRHSDQEGLNPADYHLDVLEIYLEELDGLKKKKSTPPVPALAELDLLLTDAVLLYLSHLLAGAVNPETFDKEWHANRREADLAGILQSALTSGTLQDAVSQTRPYADGYTRLKKALQAYRGIAIKNGWPTIPQGAKLQRGDSGMRVRALKERLKATGDLRDLSGSEDNLFDELAESAVINFQRRHGLEADGIAGPETLAALNIPVAERIQQIKLNLERWRWLPQSLGEKYILVNIPDFRLDVMENVKVALSMRVVVGRSYRRTPVFSDHITYIVLNPRWEVPHNIAVKDKLPIIKKDPGYLKKMHFTVMEGWGSEAKEIDPATIHWTIINEKNFPYRLRQAPGPWNALGQIKFMFPNRFNVYLHGTPEQQLFLKESRSFSSGCIRLESPLDLAADLLSFDPELSREAIQLFIDQNVEKTLRLPKPVAVYLLYWTAWVSDDGAMQFRSDIYGRDKLLAKALFEKSSPVN